MKKFLVPLVVFFGSVSVIYLGWRLMFPGSNLQMVENLRSNLPFGSEEGDLNLPTVDSRQSTDIPLSESNPSTIATSNLFQVSPDAVAGVVIFNRNASTTILRYVERATGHIVEVNLTTRERQKIVNQTMPKIYEAHFRKDGSSVVLRSIKGDVVENLSLNLIPPSASSTLYTTRATVLRGDIDEMAPGQGNTLFYTLRDNGSISSSAFDGTGAQSLYSSAFKDWRLYPVGTGLTVFSKASYLASGYAYTMTDAGLAKILGPLNGLVTVPNNTLNRVVYSYNENGFTKLFSYDIEANYRFEIVPITLAEKCVWSIREESSVYCGAPIDGVVQNEPDNWYKGKSHYTDRIWKIDTSVDVSNLLSDPKESLGVSIDVWNPQLSPNEDYLIFQNKNDLTLWAVKLD